MDFAELVCQTNFSFLEGASHPEEMVRQAYFLQYKAIAITDECSMAGVVRAYAEITRHHLPIKMIVGSKFIFEGNTIVLLCPNKKAYSECCRIITNARRRAEKGDYQLSEWDLKSIKHCLCIWLPSSNRERDHSWARWLNKHYPKRTWLCIHRWLTANEYDHISHCEDLAERYELDIIASSCALMHDPSRQALQHCQHAIREGKLISELGREALSNQEACLRPLNKLANLYPAQWLNNSVIVASLCHFDMSELAYQYPAEILPAGSTPAIYLRELVEKGIHKRFPNGVNKSIRAIIEKELKLINEQAYEYFFLTIYDIVQFAKKRNILYQGRGSAANSVVCYCLEITAVDPRQIDVLFERFISKERNEPPDIDVDFEHERREEIIQYIYQKYGRERTAIAATVVCYRFKSALREVGKVLGINRTDLDYFIKNVNRRDREISWQSQLSELGISPESSKGKHFIYLVEQLIGFPRHLSQHVGGFVISAGPLYEMVPIENASMPERTVIQWDKDDLETLKLLKVDVLALGMLTAIRKTFSLISKHYGHTYSIPCITRLPDDPQVFSQIQQADTVGIFQIESRAQMSMLPRLKPNAYYDLVVQIAIVRPGPILGDMVHPYLLRRDGKERFDYPSPEIQKVLERTMGVPIFQEQVIQLAMVAAGFSGGEADALRRAMASWKKDGELNRFKNKLTEGMTQRGYSIDYALRLFEQICGFGGYGFPESHSASFAVLAYVSAWLKHYYPDAFYVGLLNSLPMGFYSPSQIIQDAKQHKVSILDFCINHSGYDHQLESISSTIKVTAKRKDCNSSSYGKYQTSFKYQYHGGYAIRMGLRLIKGLKAASAHTLIKSRPKNGYQNIAEIRMLGLSSSCLQALASANALSVLANNRYEARWQLMDSVQELPLFANAYSTGQNESKDEIKQPSLFDNLVEDFASTGLSVNQHPIALLRDASLLPKFTMANELCQVPHQAFVSVVGLVTGKQSPGTAAGVTFITLEDPSGNISVVVWQASARAQKKAYLNAKILQVKGILERGDGGVTHVIAGKLIDQTQLLTQLDLKSREFR
ncbi:error-prone DNA polymerase [Glaciecola sp. MH2013]|nr:error-prone DNA polymerase [Glaciecola sp. MH2013]